MKNYPELEHPASFFQEVGPNDAYWSVENAPIFPNSPLKGKRILFLGSSVTLGLRSHDESMADYLAKQDGVKAIKEAMSGTTLRQETPDDHSYLSRLECFVQSRPQEKLDAVIIQLSTNDGWDAAKLGTLLGDQDPKTTYGAIEALFSLAKKTYACPLSFYTGAFYEDLNGKTYAEMVMGLRVIAKKRGFRILDLFSDPSFNVLARGHYLYWMSDGVHPYRAGYRAWWTPYFRSFLIQNLCKSDLF